jgi:hypothetical protein
LRIERCKALIEVELCKLEAEPTAEVNREFRHIVTATWQKGTYVEDGFYDGSPGMGREAPEGLVKEPAPVHRRAVRRTPEPAYSAREALKFLVGKPLFQLLELEDWLETRFENGVQFGLDSSHRGRKSAAGLAKLIVDEARVTPLKLLPGEPEVWVRPEEPPRGKAAAAASEGAFKLATVSFQFTGWGDLWEVQSPGCDPTPMRGVFDECINLTARVPNGDEWRTPAILKAALEELAARVALQTKAVAAFNRSLPARAAAAVEAKLAEEESVAQTEAQLRKLRF